MPTTNARKHSIPAGTDQSITRATIFEDFANSIRDVVPVANTTERTQLVSALTAKGQAPAVGKPLLVHRADAPGLHRLEYTVDGTIWLPASGALTFASKAAADSFGTANGGLLSVDDEARVNGVIYRWSGTAWYLPTAGARVSVGTNASGEVEVTHGMGKTPASVTATIGADGPVIPHLLHVQIRTLTATTFTARILRRDQEAPLVSNPVVFYWTAVA